MTVYRCDKCKKEVKPCNLVDITVEKYLSIKYQLCDNCARELMNFIVKGDK